MMNKITNAQIKEFVKQKLASDPLWSQQALLRIYNFQTIEEKKAKDTRFHNGVGFTGADGRILTSMAVQLKKYGQLSPKQMSIVMTKMPKYWSQIVKISNKEKLHSLIK